MEKKENEEGLDSRKEVPFMSTLNVPGVVSTDGDNQDTKSINEDTVSRRSYFFEQQEGLLPGEIYYDKERPRWEPYSCILSMVGFSVGLSNIYRFPYLCFEHGGATFLIPYMFFLVVCGIPLMYLEVIVGQFTQSGTIKAWTKLVPIFRGVGWCQCLLPLLISFYNNAFLTWALHYCVTSLTNVQLPWIGCHHDWNTLNCRDIPPDFEKVNVKADQLRAGAEYFRGRVQRRWKSKFSNDSKIEGTNITNQFGLGVQNRLGLGTPDLDMILYLLAVYVMLYFFIHAGLRFKGYLCFLLRDKLTLLVILIYRGMAIPGAGEGIKHLFSITDWTQLGKTETWVAAAEQTFFSLGTGAGVHLTLASYNNFQNNVFKDAVATVLIDTGTSLLCGTIVFIALGSIAFSDGEEIGNLFAQGPDLLFEVCSDFWGRVPGADFFAFIFFVMVFFIGFECTIEALSCSREALFEAYGEWFERNGKTRWVFINTMLVLALLVGLICITRGGLHVFMVLDKYTAGIPFRLRELCDAAEAMTGNRPNIYFQISWKFLCPIVISIIIILQLAAPTPAQYKDRNVTIVFKPSIQTFGQVYAHLPNLFVPLGILVHMFGSREGISYKMRFLLGMSPNYLHKEILETGTGCRTKVSHYLYCGDCPTCLTRKVKVAPQEEFGTKPNVPEINIGFAMDSVVL
ncbi:Sodium-dependent dopamine transporter [Folsomia candida]|uniref:Sodium-dependent dopamine transporter n=1 Tax=Folsomia candida TaxID=158441 RepID=A0A226E3D5_FOLCA|nr:Sodium-dependent dopamine transporter [Folsomia candida]